VKTKCCDFCGESFEYKSYERRFCTKACQSEWQKTLVGELNPRSYDKKNLTCEYCGNTFQRRANAKNGLRFCSHDCYGKWLKGKDKAYVYPTFKAIKKKQFVCKTCGEVFTDWPTINRIYCSNSCRVSGEIHKLHLRTTVEKRIKYGKAVAYPAMKKAYGCWAAVKTRCNNTNNCNYPKYGARGISICKEWNESFACFLKDMGLPPTDKHSIDRIDNTGNYEPNNCRWATQQEQCNNTSRNVYITFNGETHTLAQWGIVTEIKEGTMQSRYTRGWSPEKMITTPTNYKTRRI